jgi:hypothetical protein
MAKAKTRGTAARGTPRQGSDGQAVQARVRELVTAIAAEVIAEAAERLGPTRRAMPLMMARGTRSAPLPKKRG